MSGPMTTQQLAYLASEFGQMATTLQAFQDSVAMDPQVDLTDINSRIGQLTDLSRNFANQAMAAAFDDSAQMYVNLRKITEHANETAASIKQETAQVSRIAGIAASMIGLATAVATGNVVSIGKAIAALARAVHS